MQPLSYCLKKLKKILKHDNYHEKDISQMILLYSQFATNFERHLPTSDC